jgi:hypothetical protein
MYAARPCLLLRLYRLGRNAPRSPLEAAMLDLTVCPEAGCSSPAEIFDRSALPSTDGPIDHVRIRCLNRHHFLLDVRDVVADALPSPPATDHPKHVRCDAPSGTGPTERQMPPATALRGGAGRQDA